MTKVITRYRHAIRDAGNVDVIQHAFEILRRVVDIRSCFGDLDIATERVDVEGTEAKRVHGEHCTLLVSNVHRRSRCFRQRIASIIIVWRSAKNIRPVRN